MAYQSFNELLLDLALNTEEKHLSTTHKQILHAIAEIQATDTKITLPWIYHILEKRKKYPEWDIVYRHWGDIRTLFGKNDPDKVECMESDAKEPETLEQKKEILQKHIAETANALQKMTITYDTLREGILLSVTVIGLNKRFTDLDCGRGQHPSHANWFNTIKQITIQSMTKLIEYRTGRNRTDNFNPIYEAIHQLVNHNPTLRKIIPVEILPAPSTDPTFRLDTALIDPETASNELALEIKEHEKKVSMRLYDLNRYETEYKEIQSFVTRFFNLKDYNAFKEMLETHINENVVIPYDTALLDYFELTQEECAAWKYHSIRQEADFFKKLRMDIRMLFQNQYYYPNPKEIMSLFSSQTNLLSETILLLQKEIHHIQKQIHLLKAKKNKIDINILTRQTAMLIKKQVYEKKEEKPKPTIHDKPWWKKILLLLAKIALGVIVGAASGFVVGTFLGVFLVTGMGLVLTAGLSALIGGSIGLVIGAFSAKEKEPVGLDNLSDENIHMDGSIGRGNIHILKGLNQHPQPFTPSPVYQEKSQTLSSIKPISTSEPSPRFRLT